MTRLLLDGPLSLAPLPPSARLLKETVPTGTAIDAAGDLYFSDAVTNRVTRIRCGELEILPWRIVMPRGLAIFHGTLFVADAGDDTVRLFDLATRKLVAIRRGFKSPNDVAVDAKGHLYVADTGNGIVRFGSRRIDGTAIAAHVFEVNYGPDARKRFVFVPLHGRLEQTGVVIAKDLAGVDDARIALAGLLHAKGARRLFLEWDEVYASESAPPMQEPSGVFIDGAGRAGVVDRQVDYVRLFDAAGRLLGTVLDAPPAGEPAGFEKSGLYLSPTLDSRIDRCAWDRIEVAFRGGVPANAAATIATFTSNEPLADADVAALDEEEWREGNANATDFLVLSPPGRYLRLRIRFAGDGTASGAIDRLEVSYPRSSYLQYLPAVYQSDAVSRDLLDRFLRIFQSIFESFEATIDGFADHLDPDGTPSKFVEWLAGWIAMTFDGSMPEDVRRALLRHAPELYRTRGTPAGLKRFLQLAFGIDARVVEHFTLRKWAFLGSGAALGTRTQLWGRAVTPRLQLGVFSRIGEAALISTGDPLHDPFAVHAHKFSVFIPAPAVRPSKTAAAVRSLIEREKPAHAQFTLVPVEPRFRIGVQSTLGLDSVVGALPRLVLGQIGNLGFDSLLGSPSTRRAYGLRLS